MLTTKELSPFDPDTYIELWDTLEKKCNEEGFLWTALWENEEWNQYMTPSLYQMTQNEWESIQEATKEIGKIYQTAFRYLQDHPEHYDELLIPKELQKLMSIKQSLFSYFSRMDLIVKDGEVKLLEINADTPVGMMESAVGNQLICSEHGTKSPNHLEHSSQKAWKCLIDEFQIISDETIYFSSYKWHEEDTQTVSWMMNQCVHPHVSYVDFERIHVNEKGVFTSEGQRIHYLYRVYPLEFLLEESFGQLFIEHIEKGRIQLINPPATFLAQVKTLYAWIWKQAEEKTDVFSKTEQEMVYRYFLPTFTKPTSFIDQRISYVAKPVFGREGGGIEIVSFDGESVKDVTDYYRKQPKIYQEYMEMPDVTIGTWNGPYKGKMLVGSHYIGGEASGLFLRAGEKITGNLSMFFGVSVINN